MPDLSAYISFNVQMDIRNKNVPLFVLTDDSGYPGGVAAGITGIFEITQPDGGVYTGDWGSPDVVYATGALQPANIALRLATGNVLQPGTYTLKYTVDHASYSPTTLTRIFTIAYAAPTPVLTESFDVFVPSLGISDDTSYSASGYSTSGASQAWSAVIGTVGTITGSTASFSLAYGGQYYDAHYTITLVSDFRFQSTTYSYLSIKDRFTKVHVTDAWRPPTASQLLGYLKTLKTRLDALINTCQRYDTAKADYEYAYILYTHIKNRVCAGDTIGVYTYIQEILDILHSHSAISTTHTNTIIAAYNFSALCSTGGGSGNGIGAYIRVIDGTEDQESAPFNHVTFTASELIGKTILQVSLDGIIRRFTQGGTPFVPPTEGEFHFETANGLVWYTPMYNVDQYIWVLYII